MVIIQLPELTVFASVVIHVKL